MRNIDKPDAEAPSQFARRLRDQAGQQPVAFLNALVLLDGQRHDVVPEQGHAAQAKGGVRRLSVPVAGLVAWAMGHPEPGWLAKLPPEVEVVNVTLNRARRRVVLTLRSGSFPAVPEGQPIPLEQCD